MLSNNSSYEDWFSTCQITPNYHGELLYSLVNMQLASRNPLLRTGRYWLSFFWQGLLNCAPFKMHFDFHPVLRRTFAKILLSADPSHQQGAHQRNSKHQGPWCLALANASFWEAWPMHLELVSRNFRKHQKATLGSTSGRCKDALQDHGIWLWRSLTFGSLAATYEGKGKCGVPFSCRTPGPRVAGGGSP